MVTFTALLGLSCIISILYKKFVVDKIFEILPNYGMDSKKKSIRQPLVGKRDIYALTESERKLINV